MQTITIQSEGQITVTQGTPRVVILSPDGHSQYDSDIANADNAEIARLGAAITALGIPVGPDPDAWRQGLVAAYADFQKTGTGPVWPPGPYGIGWEFSHQSFDPTLSMACPWMLDDPSTQVWAWIGQTGTPFYVMVNPSVDAVLKTAKFQTKPGWALGWGPVA